jgi:hypothetical protein
VLIVLRIIGRRGLFTKDGRNKVKVSQLLAMLEMQSWISFQRTRSVGSRKREASTIGSSDFGIRCCFTNRVVK